MNEEETQAEDLEDPDYIEAQRILATPGGLNEDLVNWILGRILDLQNRIKVIGEQAELATKREQSQLNKLLRYYGPQLETWFAAFMEVQNKGKKRPLSSYHFLYGTLKTQATGGRIVVSDPEAGLKWLEKFGTPELQDRLVSRTPVLDKRGFVEFYKSRETIDPETGEVTLLPLDGVTETPRGKYTAISFGAKSGIKTVKLAAGSEEAGDDDESGG